MEVLSCFSLSFANMLDTLVPMLGYYKVKQQWTGDQLRCTAGMGTDIDITNYIYNTNIEECHAAVSPW